MIKYFYRKGSEILLGQSETEFAAISKNDLLWIDLLQPTGDQKRAVEAYLGTEIQSRDEAAEIESSSRFFEEGNAIFANTNFLSPADDEMLMDPVSFILVGSILTTIREIPLRSLDTLQLKIQALPELFPDGFTVFVEIMDKRVDLDADMVELISKDVSKFSNRIISNVFWALAGKITGLISALLVGIFVARYLGPTQYGVMNYAVSFVTLFLVIATFGFENIEIREEAKAKKQ